MKFTDSKGEAQKGANYMKLEDGTNRFRMVGDILPRYVYWVNNGKANLSFECLAFDRNQEKFTNVEKDWVVDLYPKNNQGKDTQCAWSYAVQVIDRADGKLKVLTLKKKMFAQIRKIAEKLGDPTDPETGYDIIVEKVKTGPHAFNVEYNLDQIEMMSTYQNEQPEEDAGIIAELKDIDDVLPRPTPDEQKTQLQAFLSGGEEKAEDDSVDTEAVSDLD